MQCLLALPAERDGRGPMNAHFESLALAALRAGDLGLVLVGWSLMGDAVSHAVLPGGEPPGSAVWIQSVRVKRPVSAPGRCIESVWRSP